MKQFCAILFCLFLINQGHAQVLMGMTSYGGVNNAGVVFEFNSSSSQYAYSSFDQLSGCLPTGSLLKTSNGKLYGLTSQCGINSLGTIFEFNRAAGTFTTLHDFDGINGATPFGTLIQAANGKLYGMTNSGGAGSGVIFEYDPLTDICIKKIDFSASDGSYPHGSLVQASNGKLYGMTNTGGLNAYGVIFELDPATNNFVKKMEFGGTNGSYP